MKVLTLQQGTPEWAAHRAAHFNASDAPAMLGVSPYKTRSQLVREVAKGVTAEIDDATQRRFNDGHRFEALARPLAEQIIGEELYPCVGVEGRFSASFDGLTLMEDCAFEHKTLNDDLRAVLRPDASINELPEMYRVQMEHQCMVSGAERVLFMASKWNGDELVEERHCWYYPDSELRARIIVGWEQFERDVAAYQPEAPAAPQVTGRAPDALPALRIEVQGMVTASNLAEFREVALTAIRSVNRALQTDEDFADAEQAVKWCADVESRLESAKSAVLAQTASIDDVFRTLDTLADEARRTRLDLDKLVKARKDTIRTEIVDAAWRSVLKHYEASNATLGEHRVAPPHSLQAQIGAAIKGKKTLASITDAANTAAANLKLEASQKFEAIRANIAVLNEHQDHASLFADRVVLCATYRPDDLRSLIAARISDHQRREAAKLEVERERIRAEERAEAAAAVGAVAVPAQYPNNIATVAVPAAPTGARIKLGEINSAIAPLSITADGLAQLGFHPVGTERAAKLYAASDMISILTAIRAHLSRAEREARLAA